MGSLACYDFEFSIAVDVCRCGHHWILRREVCAVEEDTVLVDDIQPAVVSCNNHLVLAVTVHIRNERGGYHVGTRVENPSHLWFVYVSYEGGSSRSVGIIPVEDHVVPYGHWAQVRRPRGNAHETREQENRDGRYCQKPFHKTPRMLLLKLLDSRV